MRFDNKITLEWAQAPISFMDLLDGLDFREMYALADFLDSQAIALRNRATVIAARAAHDREFEKRLDYLKNDIPAAMRTKLRAGMEPAQAVSAVSALTGVRPETITLHWTRHLRSSKATNREKRNQTIADLAVQGFSNAEIARRFGLHEKSVPRILKEIDKRRNVKRPPELLPDVQKYKAKLAENRPRSYAYEKPRLVSGAP